jgi:hypothetical protein
MQPKDPLDPLGPFDPWLRRFVFEVKYSSFRFQIKVTRPHKQHFIFSEGEVRGLPRIASGEGARTATWGCLYVFIIVLGEGKLT